MEAVLPLAAFRPLVASAVTTGLVVKNHLCQAEATAALEAHWKPANPCPTMVVQPAAHRQAKQKAVIAGSLAPPLDWYWPKTAYLVWLAQGQMC